MTDTQVMTITTLTPNLSTLGEYIQQNVLNGYRLVEGYPNNYGWQYQVVMTKAAADVAPKKAVGRPPKD